MKLRIVSLNIRGVTGKEKFLANLAAKLKLDFMFLQESYIDSERRFVELLEEVSITKGTYSAGKSNSRGVCTLQFSDNYEITGTNQDNEGRCTIARIKSRDGLQEMTLVNTYAPCNKQEQREFIEEMHKKLENFHQNQKMIWGGDFNIDHRDNTIESRSLLETIQSFKLKNTAESLKNSNMLHTFRLRDNRIHTLRNLDRLTFMNLITPSKYTTRRCISIQTT